MLYLTGQQALNLPCSLETCGDWHSSAIQWQTLRLKESSDSIWGDYGIERNVRIPQHSELYNAANHIRALLDLLAEDKLTLAQGINNDFICNDSYTSEIFEKVAQMRTLSHWARIDEFMGREYHARWLDYKEAHNVK